MTLRHDPTIRHQGRKKDPRTPPSPPPSDDPGDPIPNASWTKNEIVEWFQDQGVSMSRKAKSRWTKDELLGMVAEFLDADRDPEAVSALVN